MNQINSGTIINLQISSKKGHPLSRRSEAEFITGLGISGDSHAGKSESRQILLMDTETQQIFGINPDVTRENVTTKDLNLSNLRQGDLLVLGDSVRIEVTGDCEPCKNLDLQKPGLSEAIKGQRGILAKVIDSGFVKVNSKIVLK
jgi:MOSC domain-containing protein YiiM